MYLYIPWNIFAVLLGHVLALLFGHLVAHLLGLLVALGGWNYRGYSLLNILALFSWYWVAD